MHYLFLLFLLKIIFILYISENDCIRKWVIIYLQVYYLHVKRTNSTNLLIYWIKLKLDLWIEEQIVWQIERLYLKILYDFIYYLFA